MNRDATLREARRQYIKQCIENADIVSDEIEAISKRLFISERTVWRDIRSVDTTAQNIDKQSKHK